MSTYNKTSDHSTSICLECQMGGGAHKLSCSHAPVTSKDVVKRLPKLCDAPGCCVSTFNAYCERHQHAPPDYLLDAEIQAQGIDGMTHEIKRLRAENTRLWLLKRPADETTPEPVAWMTDEENPRVVKDETRARMSGTTRDACCIPLYRSPPEEPAREHLHWCAVNIGKDCNCWCDHPRSELLARKGDAFEMRKCLECTKIFRVRLRTPQGEPALTPPQELPGMREPVVIAPQGNAGESPASLPEKASECICPRRDADDSIIYTHVACPVHALNGDGGS